MEGVYKTRSLFTHVLGNDKTFITPYILPMSDTISKQFLEAATNIEKSRSNFM